MPSSSWTTSALTAAAQSGAPLKAVGAMLFSKLKHGLRRAAVRAQDALFRAIINLLPIEQNNDCANYYVKAGYART